MIEETSEMGIGVWILEVDATGTTRIATNSTTTNSYLLVSSSLFLVSQGRESPKGKGGAKALAGLSVFFQQGLIFSFY